jgi:predicted Zn-dependent protease
MIMKPQSYCIFVLLIVLSARTFSMTKQYPKDKSQLEQEVKSILRRSNVDMRSDVEKVFMLGDIYYLQGNFKKAKYYFTEGLKVNSWNLPFQLKLARILLSENQKPLAVEKANFVYEYAEDESLIKGSVELLGELGEDITRPNLDVVSSDKSITIALVPLGKVNMLLLEEVAAEAEEILGLNFIIYDLKISDLGPPDRPYAVRRMSKLYESILKNADKNELERLKRYVGDLNTDSLSYEMEKEFVLRFLKSQFSNDEYNTFIENLDKQEKQGQYNAGRLTRYLINHRSEIPGYVDGCLAITNEDIYDNDYNFLFGQAGPQYGTMSYCRFTADFNDDDPNRPRLRKRTLKQCISSTFFIVGIKRCTSPTCARAYPHDLSEHDRKSISICNWCKEQLTQVKKTHP